MKIKYIHGDESMLDRAHVMWEALNQCMYERSTYFKNLYLGMAFEKRKAELLEKAANGLIRIDVALDETTGQGIGYLISSITFRKVGEIESVFVYEAYRGMGIGDKLMRNALAWMDQNGVREKIVEASVGNEQAWDFYGRFGFLPRKTTLKQAKKA